MYSPSVPPPGHVDNTANVTNLLTIEGLKSQEVEKSNLHISTLTYFYMYPLLTPTISESVCPGQP